MAIDGSKALPADDAPLPERAHNRQSVIEARGLALLVGIAALAMPAVLFGSNILQVSESTADLVCFQDSISHYYYALFLGDFFVICLAAIGVILIAFKGDSIGEAKWSTRAGFGALGVALVPTTGNGCDAGTFAGRVFGDLILTGDGTAPVEEVAGYFSIFPTQDSIHFAFAAAVFLSTLVFCFKLWRKVEPWHEKDGAATAFKDRRNGVYRLSGGLIAFSLLAIVFNVVAGWFDAEVPYWDFFNGTFVFESLALGSFGYAWLVRGRFIARYDDEAELDRREKFRTAQATA